MCNPCLPTDLLPMSTVFQSECVNSQMHLAALATFRPIVACTRSAFGRRLHRTAIEDSCRRLLASALSDAQYGAQVVGEVSKYASSQPSLCLLIYDWPGGQVVRHHAPRSPCTNQPAQAVEDFAQWIISLWRILIHQSQIGHKQCPFFVTNIAGISFASHSKNLSQHKVHNRL
jgi:hypothetical protein